ncbi:hypothetical protein L0128_10290 [candidate division KSB1 bacterium]|nr:hypothetical protein [candidate division KSB1 bacterium]
MINQYKRVDVFRCNYGEHSKFENQVSVYHVLQRKKCWPDGCISFKWNCQLMNKGKRCIKGYQHQGRKCDGCGYYFDTKIHQQPIIRLPEPAATQFWEDLADFEEWLLEHRGRELALMGTISSVKPRYVKYLNVSQAQLKLYGVLLIFQSGYFGIQTFDDYFYVQVPSFLQSRFQFAAEDTIEFRAKMQLDRGRIIFTGMRQVEFVEKSGQTPLKLEDLLVAKQTATIFKTQLASCLHCKYGVLVDVKDHRELQTQQRRELYCLQGMPDPFLCGEPARQQFARSQAELGECG